MTGERILVVDDSATIRRVVEMTLLRAGFVVDCAVDGQDGLQHAQQAPPQMILLDFVMPRMNGFQFCHALRGVANLRDIPVVLMSAKGDKIGGQFVEQTGAVDAITKPFSPDALLAVVGYVIAKWRGRAMPEPSPDDKTDPNRPMSDDPNETAGARVADSLQAIATRLGACAVEALARVCPDIQSSQAEALRTAVACSLSREELVKLGVELRALEPGEHGEPALGGDLAMVGLGEVLQLVQLQKQTGVVEVSGSGIEVSICFREGVIDLAQSRGGPQDMLLGRYLVEEDLLSKQDLEMLLKNRGSSRRLLGDQLVKLGYILAEDLQRALTRQTNELVYEVLRWKSGRFVFLKGARRPEADAAKLALPVAAILLEGFRRVDEWRLIEQHIQSFDLVLQRDDEAIDRMGSGRLTREEALVLDFVNSRNTVRDIAERTRMGTFEASRILYRLLQVGLIRKRSAAA